MHFTVKNKLSNLSFNEYQTLKLLCHLSKNLFNEALYSVRQFYFAEKKYLRYEQNYHVCKTSENYKALGTDIAQQTMKYVDRAFKSFFSCLASDKDSKVRLPHYLDKTGYFPLILPTNHITFKDGYFALPMARSFKKEHCELKFQIPPQLDPQSIKEIRILPKHKAQFFEIEFVYEREPVEVDLDSAKFLGIDLGLDNLATCVTSGGASFILDGKNLKSYNRLYNKENARLQSAKDKQGIKGITRRQYLNLQKRNRRVNHAMSVAARRIVNYCVENRIGNIVVGYNPDWKREINIGKQNNQNFVQIPHGKLRDKLKYLCELYSISYIEQEESYTSKASFFDDDLLPTYDANNSQPYKFSGRRITRGQYRSACGIILNADVNGALNILRKCSLISLVALQDRGCVSQPRRIRIF